MIYGYPKNELWISINDLWISINELWISINKKKMLKRHLIFFIVIHERLIKFETFRRVVFSDVWPLYAFF